jgi:HD-like signal output (HDOD) protein
VESRVNRFGVELDAIFVCKSSLPTLPDLMIQVQRALANELGGLDDLARIIERDPGLTARLLRVANSPAFNIGSEVTTISAAVGRLGIKQVRALCMAVGVVQAFAGSGKGLDHARYWEHSAAVGLVAERLAQASPLHSGVDGAEVYVAGLLHDVGLLLLDQFFAMDFATIRQETDDELTGIWHVENRRLGLDHGEIGGRLLSHWKLPDPVVAAVTLSGSWSESLP